MAINFPSSPTTGQVYEYQSIRWRWNGSAWDKYEVFTFNGLTANVEGVSRFNGLTGPVGISAGQLIDITLTGSTFTISSPDTLYGISGNIYASSLATGLLYGGILSINAGNTAQFDITGGKGQIHASGSGFTSGPFPLFNYVTWPGQTGITLTYLATHDTTWIYIDETGVVHQRTEYYTDEQLEENIIIGQLLHPSRAYINLARTNPNVAYATDKQYEQFIRAFGPIKVSGHTITPNGANLKLNRSSGKAFSLGRNWINDTDNPSVVSDSAQTDCIFYRYYRGATAGTFITVPNQTVIDPGNYDDGSGTLQAAPGGKYSIQRLFYYPNTPTLLGVYYGRALYNSLADAAANINLEEFTEIENTRTNAIFAGYLIVRAGTTNLSNSSDALILQSGSFRSTTSGGGSVSLTLDDLTDVIITSPQDLQVLTYVDGVTGWENKSVSTLPLVYSFNGATGAVSGVTTSVANIFGPVQTFNSGISAAGATFNGSVTVTGNLTVSGGVTFTTSEIVLIEDNIITLNSNVTGTPTENSGIEIERGTSPNVLLLWNETTDRWTFTNDGTQYYDLPTNVVNTFNGLTGTVTGVTGIVAGAGINISGTTRPTIINAGVTQINGLTGALTVSGGTGMSVLSAGTGITLVNTGVLSIDGGTGAITNVARTNVDNRFSEDQTISKPFGSLRIENTILGYTGDYKPNNISYYSGSSSQTINSSPTNPSNNITLPAYTTTLAGLAGTQTFTGVNTFSSVANFSAGLSASGATFTGDIAVNGGDITTTATTATIFNSNATTLSMGGANAATVNIGNGTGVTLNIGTGSLFGGVKNINIGSNGSFGTSTINIGNNLSTTNILGLNAGSINLGILGSAPSVNVQGIFSAKSSADVTGLLTANAGISAAGATLSRTTTIPAGSTLSVLGNITGNVVSSIDGGTGAVTNVARTNADNNFTSPQTVTNGIDLTTYGLNERYFFEDISGSETFLYPTNSGTNIVYLPAGPTTTLAGLATTQTFTGLNTFNTLTTFNAGITASGITASGKVQAATYTETSNQIRVTNNARSWFL